MRKQRKIIYNLIHLNQFKLYQTPKLHFYLDYKNYFLGDAFSITQKIPTHIDLTTQSLNYEILSNRKKNLKAIKSLQQFTFKLSSCYYKKLRFLGKGYKIKKSKKKKSFKLYFGRSHRQYLFSGGLRFKKLSKYRLYLLTNNKKRLNRIMNLTLKAKPLNRYTKRGFRCTRQFILKRPGKKSTY